MHVNHKVFVNLKEIPRLSEENIKEDILCFTEEHLSQYQNKAFEYFEFVDKEPVLYGRDCGAGKLISMLRDIRQNQHEYIRKQCSRMDSEDMARVSGMYFEDMCHKMLDDDPRWLMAECLRIADGEYMADSEFYDIYHDTAKVTDDLITLINSNPEEWAVVTIDVKY